MLNENIKTFIVYVFFLSLELIYLDKKAQIAPLFIEKVTIPDKYSDFDNVFLKK